MIGRFWLRSKPSSYIGPELRPSYPQLNKSVKAAKKLSTLAIKSPRTQKSFLKFLLKRNPALEVEELLSKMKIWLLLVENYLIS